MKSPLLPANAGRSLPLARPSLLRPDSRLNPEYLLLRPLNLLAQRVRLVGKIHEQLGPIVYIAQFLEQRLL